VSITPRGLALGVTYQQPEEDRHSYSEDQIHARIVGAMGGRAAEELVYGSRTTGAESDMQQVTDLVRKMVTRWGMSEKLGPLTVASSDEGTVAGSRSFGYLTARPYSESTAQLIDAEMRRIVQEAYDEALRLLRSHRAVLDALARALLERETLDEQEILAVTGLRRAPRLVMAPRQAITVLAA
jgi:cell division protease FtsH